MSLLACGPCQAALYIRETNITNINPAVANARLLIIRATGSGHRRGNAGRRTPWHAVQIAAFRLQIYISNLKIHICSLRKFGSTVCRGDRHAGHRSRASRPVTGTSLCHRQMARRCSEQLLAHRQFVCRLNDVARKLVHARRLVPVEIYGIHWRLGRIIVDAHPPVKTIDIVMHAVHA